MKSPYKITSINNKDRDFKEFVVHGTVSQTIAKFVVAQKYNLTPKLMTATINFKKNCVEIEYYNPVDVEVKYD